MTESAIDGNEAKTEAEAEEFIDELSDEALDRAEGGLKASQCIFPYFNSGTPH